MEPVTPSQFGDWKHSTVTKKLFKLLSDEREEMKEGLVMGAYENEAEVKGRCKTIMLLLNITYEDLFPESKYLLEKELADNEE